VYLEMGTERSLLGVVNKTKKAQNSPIGNCVPGAWKDNAEKWQWKKRAEAHDIAEIERRRVKFEAECDEWTSSRFEDARSLRAKAREYLALPVIQETVKDGGKTFIIEPLSSKQLRDAAATLKVADELARITTRETLPVTKVAPVTPDGKEEYGKDADRQRLALINQLIAAEQEKNSGPDTE